MRNLDFNRKSHDLASPQRLMSALETQPPVRTAFIPCLTVQQAPGSLPGSTAQQTVSLTPVKQKGTPSTALLALPDRKAVEDCPAEKDAKANHRPSLAPPPLRLAGLDLGAAHMLKPKHMQITHGTLSMESLLPVSVRTYGD
eukprot:3494085-Amphidinium_carterae.1